MPANHKVSVTWQIVFTFLPVVNLWAFYRIRKLRKYLLYVFLPSSILSIGYIAYYYSIGLGNDFATFDFNAPPFLAYLLPNIIGWSLQGLAIYLVIIWSRQHNIQFNTHPAKG
jgi:hypothetical protein